MNSVDLQKLRRFSLFVSTLLIVYIFSGMELKGNELSILGNTFVSKRVLPVRTILLCLSLYGMLRFLYYGVITTIHPIQARAMLRRNEIPEFGWALKIRDSANSRDYAAEKLRRHAELVSHYFPGIEYRENMDINDFISASTKRKYFFSDLDYYGPIWIGLLAAICFVVWCISKRY